MKLYTYYCPYTYICIVDIQPKLINALDTCTFNNNYNNNNDYYIKISPTPHLMNTVQKLKEYWRPLVRELGVA